MPYSIFWNQNVSIYHQYFILNKLILGRIQTTMFARNFVEVSKKPAYKFLF